MSNEKNPYVPPAVQKHLDELCAETRALAKSRTIVTDADRAIVLTLLRLTETLANGEPTAQPEKRHHE